MYSLIVFLPLLAAIVAGLFGRKIGYRAAQAVTCGAVIIAAILSVITFFDVALGTVEVHQTLLSWIQSGDFQLNWSIKIDTLTAMMLVVVTVVSSVVHVYSIGYMEHDPHKERFMAYLSLFTFAMLMLVTSDNFVQLFFGWEGVGLASYLLIGFWYKKPSANAAAIKAFVVNRVGDFGFSLGIFAIFVVFHSVNYDDVFMRATEMVGHKIHFLSWDFDALTTICLLLFVGAMGKSAQLGLHTWLPDAMEGPTPVSALIHAATMVTAGVFMVVRCSPLFELSPDALAVVTVIGASTAFFAASVGLVQNDIKRVIAYSTCSQLGYMFFAAGVGAYGAAAFHLFTHAFFKALLFLGSGSVIHGMHDEQDMRKMGGLWKKLPVTYIYMWIGSLSLMGIPFFSGYYSKDTIIESAYAAGTSVGYYAFTMGIIAAFMTAFYSGRLIFMTFHGKTRADHDTFHHAHDAPKIMNVPLALLALGAVIAGFIFHQFFVGTGYEEFWRQSIYLHQGNDVLEKAEHIPSLMALLPLIVGLAGLGLSWVFYVARPGIPKELAKTFHFLYQFLLNKWYFDELYDYVIIRPAKWIGTFFWKQGDGYIIDGWGPNRAAAAVVTIARKAKTIQTGYVYHYAFAIVVGVALIVTWYLIYGGAR